MDESRLIEKLRLIEALFAGATTEGERVAAGRARGRILERLSRAEQADPPVEYRFSMNDMWSRKVFVALLRRYGIRPYRYRGQRHTTVMARVSRGFVDETLWPEFREIAEALRTYLSEVTDRVVARVLHQDSSEPEVVARPAALAPVAGNPSGGAGRAGAAGAAGPAGPAARGREPVSPAAESATSSASAGEPVPDPARPTAGAPLGARGTGGGRRHSRQKRKKRKARAKRGRR